VQDFLDSNYTGAINSALNEFATALPQQIGAKPRIKLLEIAIFDFCRRTESYLPKTPDPTLDHKEAYA